jgi:hypothetical protein
VADIQIPERIFLDRLGGDEVFGFGQDGDVTIASNTTLTRDMYYNNLTINSSCDLDTNGYRIFVKDTLTFTDATSRIGRFTNKTTAGTLKGGATKGTAATDTLGGRSAAQTTFAVTYASSVFAMDGTGQDTLSLYVGNTYTFLQEDSTNVGHRIKFSETSDGTHNSGSAYTTGVTESGTLAVDGDANTVIEVTSSTPSTLYYYCETHASEGGTINVSDTDPNLFFSGEEELFNLSVAVAGRTFDMSSGTYKFLEGGSGTSDSTQVSAAQEGQTGGNNNWANRNTLGAQGGKGYTGNAATSGTGAVGGGVVVVVAKSISGDGAIRADGDDAVDAAQGTKGNDAPDYYQSGTNYSYGYSYTNYGSNPTNYGSNPTTYGSNPTNYGTNPPVTHYHNAHYHPTVYINNFTQPGFVHTHYHLHPGTTNTHPGNTNTHPGNNYSYAGNNYSYTGYGSNYGANANVFHSGGAGGTGEKVSEAFNAGGGTVVLVSGSKPLPSGLTTSAAAGTSGAGTATAGTILTIFNIAATDTAP